MLTVTILVLLVLTVLGGGLGHSRYGYLCWFPVAIVLVIAHVLFLTGHLHF